MNAKLQIFVSSTYTDLREERQAAVEAILKSGHIPAGMELFSAGDQTQLEVIQRWISDSDVYMLILGGRYGSIHRESETSYVELEYDYALSLDKPVFAVVIKEDELEARVKRHGTTVIERDNPQKLKEFRERVLGLMSSFFDDPKDIKLAVHETIPDLQRRYALSGWVRADALEEMSVLRADLADANKRNSVLQKEVAALAKNLEKAKAKLGNQWPDDELLEIARSLESDQIKRQSEKGEMLVSVLALIRVFKNALVIGVDNRVGMSTDEKLLFFKVLPKLEIYGMAHQEKNAGVQWRTYRLNSKGTAFLAFLERLEQAGGSPATPKPSSQAGPVSVESPTAKSGRVQKKKP